MPVMRRKKVCRFCDNKIDYVDFKEERMLRRFVNDRGKLLPRRITGNCAIHQREVTTAVKRARTMAILAFASESYR